MIRIQAMERLIFIWRITSFESSRIIDSCQLHKHFMNKHEVIDRVLPQLFFNRQITGSIVSGRAQVVDQL